MSHHVTVAQLAEASALDEKDVLRLCDERSIPIYRGRIDKTLFSAEMRQHPPGRPRR